MIIFHEAAFDKTARIATALDRVISANPHLTYLALSKGHSNVDWTPHLQSIFKVMEVHHGLRTFCVNIITEESFSFSCLERLLSRKRNVKVVDSSEDTITTGTSIEKIYSLNRFFHDSASLTKVSAALRPQLVASALAESASGIFQRTALLLDQHTDMLCKFVGHMEMEVLLLEDWQHDEA